MKVNRVVNRTEVIKCLNGYFADKKINRCLKYIDHCLEMDLYKCKRCAQGYFLNQSHSKCINCNPNCLQCNFQDSCHKCAFGFYPDFNKGNFNYINILNILKLISIQSVNIFENKILKKLSKSNVNNVNCLARNAPLNSFVLLARPITPLKMYPIS